MDARSIVSSRGQVVIPKMVRKFLGLHYGSEIILNVRQDKVLEIRSAKYHITDFFGKGKHLVSSSQITDIDQSIEQAVRDNIGLTK